MSHDADLLPLIALVYGAAGHPSQWAEFLEAYARAFGSVVASFSRRDMRRGRKGDVLFDGQIDAGPALQNTAFRGGGLIALDAVYSASGVISRSRDDAVVLTVHRGRRQAQWDESDLRSMRILLPHVIRAREAEGRRQWLAAGVSALDALGIGLVVVLASAEILHANQVAGVIFEKADGLAVREGALHASSSSGDAGLRQAIGDATVAVPDIARPSVVPITRVSSARPYQLVVSPVVQGGPEFDGTLSPRATIVIVDPELPRAISPDALRSLYGLTKREAALASGLSTGATLQAAAFDLGMTFETARTHLRRVLEKTGTSRQAGLIGLLAGVPSKVPV